MSASPTIGISGKNISLSANPLPSGVTCYLSGYCQSAASQFAQVQDQNGNIVAQIGGNGNPVTMSPTGGYPYYFKVGSGPYTVSIGNSGTQYNQVLLQYQSISSGTKTYMGAWLFISEDAGDADFNDSTVLLSWNLYSG